MPLSRVTCVTHYTGFPFGSASFTELLCWYGTVLSALPQFTCRNSVDPGWPSSALFLFGWQTLSSPCKHLDYAASSILSCCSFNWNSHPSQIRLLPKSYTPCSTSCLKLIFFTVVGLEAPPSRFLERALYKFSKWMKKWTTIIYCYVMWFWILEKIKKICWLGKCVDVLLEHKAFTCSSTSGAWWRIGWFVAFGPKGRGFESRSSRHVGILGKSITRCCLWRFGVKLRHSRPIRAVSGALLISGGLEEAL